MGVYRRLASRHKFIKMKSLLVFAALLAVGFSEESKAPVVVANHYNPYLYGHPGYYNAAPLAYNYAPVAAPVAALPQTYAPAYTHVAPVAPVVAPVPAPAISSQFAAQDEFGNTQYGYSNLNSAKHEVGNAFTGVSGSYQYVDANGKLQTVNYVADALGFRVEDTRLPVAPVYDGVAPEAPVYDGVAPEAPVYDGVAPEPVQDTPEVVAAREAHLAAFEEIAARTKRETDPAAVYGYNTPYLLHSRFQPWNYNGIYAYNRLSYMGHHPRFAYGYYY